MSTPDKVYHKEDTKKKSKAPSGFEDLSSRKIKPGI